MLSPYCRLQRLSFIRCIHLHMESWGGRGLQIISSSLTCGHIWWFIYYICICRQLAYCNFKAICTYTYVLKPLSESIMQLIPTLTYIVHKYINIYIDVHTQS
jgi:hypothetical protein